jgi:hypothetical protein
MPLNEPTVAMEGVPLLHVPPPVGSESVVVYPAQTVKGPVMAATAGFTVTVATEDAVHPKPLVTVAVYVNTVEVDIEVGCR